MRSSGRRAATARDGVRDRGGRAAHEDPPGEQLRRRGLVLTGSRRPGERPPTGAPSSRAGGRPVAATSRAVAERGQTGLRAIAWASALGEGARPGHGRVELRSADGQVARGRSRRRPGAPRPGEGPGGPGQRDPGTRGSASRDGVAGDRAGRRRRPPAALGSGGRWGEAADGGAGRRIRSAPQVGR
ncbi:hypothetical protein LV779_07000 [Streptomyces thinghirensis]|nr:hypothetical protein [Streptomyces thinghirensis]